MKFNPMSNYREESGGARFLRTMLLICVFIGVGWLYTKHFDNALEDIKTRSAILDKSGALSSDQKAQFRDFAKLFREELGIELVLRIADGTPEPPKLKAKSLYIGIDSTGGKLIVVSPPWIEKSLGSGFNDELQEHMRPYFESDSWPTGLMKALQLIWERVTGLDTGGRS
ncbi:hypothetical protein [Desulfovibrio ferrophilus]|uniref:Uncharacterized protein n=1 Tax=Desulfovibrio ferrophilus TaxID=241368 RepID=A0A2Z6B062_9BACT|nr:hypothetical protein [Desulfovibrio ferrophilus]BBD08891.1 uncharacterized protein DFE_2165 [Desulfovibrio ferrophilus]